MRALVVVGCLVACQADPTLSDTSQALTSISATSLVFDSTQVGSTSAARSGFIYETTKTVGTHTDTINSVGYSGSCGEFAINAPPTGTVQNQCYNDTTCYAQCPVAPVGIVTCDDLQDYSFSATYRPTVAATVSCVVTFYTSSGSNSVTLQGTGLPPPIHVAASPGSLAFGGVRINTASTAIGVNVGNSGGQSATISSVSVSGGFAIVSGNTGAHALGPGATEGFGVTCNPSAVGPLNGTLTVQSNDPSTPTINLGMSCSGIDSALAISPSPAVLNTIRVGESEQKTITITNMGGAATSIQAVTVTGMTMVSAPPAGTMLGPSASTTAVVQFDATAKQDVSGTLHVDYDNGKSVDTQVTAKAVNVALSLTPDGEIDVGNVCVGQSKDQSFKLIGTDEGAFVLSAASTTDPSDPTFALKTPTLPATIQGLAANAADLTLTVAPQAEGDLTTQLTLTTDIPNTEPHVVNVHALALAAGVNGPPQVDLGGNPINQTSIGRHVEISNCTESPVTITQVQLTGEDALEFAIVDQPQDSTIPAHGSASWLVVMQAHTVGDKAASFDATTGDGAVTSVPLVGDGLGSGTGGGDSTDTTKSSYYACSTGTPTSVWPIGFALAGLLVRRRRR